MLAVLHGASVRADGRTDTFWSVDVEIRVTDPPKCRRRRDGYGSRIPTSYEIRFNGRWRRVYAAQWSNLPTLYIGKLGQRGAHERLTVSVYT